ncbi:MAG: pseudouridine synthase, partial [Angelakisella sp.]
VVIDGKRVEFPRKKENIYIMLNKPRGYVTTTSDELGRRCVTELVSGIDARVYPVGRLDKNTEGLLLMTNDGEFANLMMHPRNHVTKTYRLTVRPDINDDQLVKLSTGVQIGESQTTLPASVLVMEKEPGRVVLQISITEGKNRQIRRMCEAVGLEVARLKRISVGPLKLGMLQPGQWRELQKSEVLALRNAGTLADEVVNEPGQGRDHRAGRFGKNLGSKGLASEKKTQHDKPTGGKLFATKKPAFSGKNMTPRKPSAPRKATLSKKPTTKRS